jgi:hypothetical protein
MGYLCGEGASRVRDRSQQRSIRVIRSSDLGVRRDAGPEAGRNGPLHRVAGMLLEPVPLAAVIQAMFCATTGVVSTTDHGRDIWDDTEG